MKEKESFRIIGFRYDKIEAVEKVTGRLKFCGDIVFPGTLHAKILRSPCAHAMIKNIDISKAKSLKGVKAIITHRDVPKIPAMHQYLHLPHVMFFDSYLLEEKVRHVGDRVAAVVAITPEIAEEAIELIKVEYELMEAVFNPVEASMPGAPVIHEVARRGEKWIEIRNNIVSTRDIEIGNVEKGFKEADLVIENEFRTSRPNNAPLEKTTVICRPGPGGRLEVYSTTQGIHPLRMNMASSLGIPLHKVNCHRLYLGGSFGAHIHMGFIEPICGFLALMTGLPVRGEKTREEMFFSCGRHPMIMKLKTGVKKDGTMVAQHLDLIDDTGAYAYSGESKMVLAGGFFMSMYRCSNQKFTGKTVYTNTPPLTAMRGAGNPQIHFAVESQMDIIAGELGIDPVDLRLKNHIRQGDTFYGQGHDVVSVVKSCGTEELLKRGAELIGWNRDRVLQEERHPAAMRDGEKEKQKDKGGPWIMRGLGMARGFHTSGCGSEKPSKFIMDYSGAIVKINEDGTAVLLNAAADSGGGDLTAHAAMVAEELGLRLEDVFVYPGDTDSTPFDVPTHASRGVYGSGSAVRAATRKAKDHLFKWASDILEAPVEILSASDGKIFISENPSKSVSIKEVVQKGVYNGWGTIVEEASVRPTACPPHFIVVFAEVEVDTETGVVKVLRAVSGADVGTIINKNSVEGQMEGGFHMGSGFALLEDTAIDRATGKILNPNFMDYKILTGMDIPTMNTIIAETFEPTGPFGAKGVGEGVTNPVAAAVCNAIYDAVGIRIKELPASCEKILNGLRRHS